MARKKLDLTHFASRANEAAFWEAWVGAILSRCGLYTVHHPFTVANNPGEVHLYGETFDLDVGPIHPYGCCEHHDQIPMVETEVKSLSLTFTCPEDYPFDQVLVCSENSHKRKSDQYKTPRPFLMVSRPTGAIVYVPAGTDLAVRSVHDASRGETYKVVYCKKGDLRGLKAFVQAVGG